MGHLPRQNVSVRRWELWAKDWDKEGVGGEQTFFREDNAGARRMAIEDGHTFVWECTATDWDDAHRAMYLYRGWGEYQPILGPDGRPIPEEG
jgi:hypothetical protein